jgi:hypothetical protein
VVGEHMLTGRMAEYPLIVVPEWEYLEPKFRDDLIAYAKNGGNLLLIGAKTAALFQPELGVTLEQGDSGSSYQLRQREATAALKGPIQRVQPAAGIQTVGELRSNGGSSSQPAATINRLGKGKIAAVWFSLGQSYPDARSEVVRQVTRDLAEELSPAPLVEVTGSPAVDVCVARKNGNLLVNLVNTSGPHQTEPIIESIAPLGPLAVVIRQPTKPTRVTLEPGSRPLPFDYQNGQIRLTVPKVELHEVILVETK